MMSYEGEIQDNKSRWEYAYVISEMPDSYASFCEKLNAWGFEGWEVINISESREVTSTLPWTQWKAWVKRKYRFERKRIFQSDSPNEEIPFGGELRDYVYYV